MDLDLRMPPPRPNTRHAAQTSREGDHPGIDETHETAPHRAGEPGCGDRVGRDEAERPVAHVAGCGERNSISGSIGGETSQIDHGPCPTLAVVPSGHDPNISR